MPNTPLSTGFSRFLIGGIGGFTPIFALLVAVDFDKNLDGTTASHVAGYLVRAMALFLIGGFIAWLHDSEHQKFKLFEIGLGAPALIAGLITTNSLVPPTPVSDPTRHPVASWFVSPAYAQNDQTRPVAPSQQPSDTNRIKEFSFPVVPESSQFFQGLTGIRGNLPTNVYYVIAGSYKSQALAEEQAASINSNDNGIRAEVYAPYADNPYFAVVIGSQLDKASANALRTRAIKIGFPNDTYIWTTPALKY